MPLDILLPFWGDPEFLFATVDSVLAQESDDWVLTVVDDAYPDESVATRFAAINDPRITYHRNEKNLGITDNYRRCLELATHDVMVFLGCDDLLLPNYVDTVLAAHAAHPDAAIIQPGVQVIDEHDQVSRTLVDSVKQRVVMPRSNERQLLEGERLAANLLHGNWMYWPSLVFRRDRLSTVEFLDDLPFIQDLALVMDLIFQGEQLVLDPTVCFSYRRHSESASSTSLHDGRRFAGERAYFEIAATKASALGWRRAERAAKLRITSRAHALALAPGALLKGNAGAARGLMAHAIGR